MAVPFVFSVLVACLIFNEGRLTIAPWTKDNIDLFLDFYRVPLVILSLAFPFAAIAIANHRSVQAVKAMEINTAQNHFSNYYFHREQFQKRLDNLVFVKEVGHLGFRVNSYALYSMVFSCSSVNSVQVEPDIDVYEKMLKIYSDSFREWVVKNGNENEYRDAFMKWASLMGVTDDLKPEKVDDIGIHDICNITAAIVRIVMESVEFGVVNSTSKSVFEEGANEYAGIAFRALSDCIKIDYNSN